MRVAKIVFKDVACKGCRKKDKKHHAQGYCKACYAKAQRLSPRGKRKV